MFERVETKGGDDDELEMLLDEIPHATCFNHHHHHPHSIRGVGCYEYDQDLGSNARNKMQGGNFWYDHHACVSPVSGFSLKSDGSSSSFVSGGSPTPSPFEEVVNSQFHCGISGGVNRLWIDPDSYHANSNKRSSDEERFFELNRLSRSFSGMYINEEEQQNRSNGKSSRVISDKYWSSGVGGFGSPLIPVTRNDHLGVIGQVASPVVINNQAISTTDSQFHRMKVAAHLHQMGVPFVDPPSNAVTSNRYPRVNGRYATQDSSNNVPKVANIKPHVDSENIRRYKGRHSCGVKIPMMRNIEAFDREDGLMKYGNGNGHRRSVRAQERRSSQIESGVDERVHHFPFSLPLKLCSLGEAKGYIYEIAKDQHGCRFLQRMFDEGSRQDVKTIFNEIIDHAVELMMNPFGNYLMQKLLEVCNEEQRMEIILRVTQEPGQIVRISLNTHGTRVVQKLIETLKTRQQISMVISSLEPGFLALIKDLNGNHVIQRCLQYLTIGDTEFIFNAAARYCMDIATHQHGCCVLQRCIAHAVGEHRERLIAEISANGLLLAQDAFGNYVVQFILELKIPSATSKLISHFEGNFVHLSTQKFSSHVVEKCLIVCDYKVQSKIIHELVSAPHFEHLLQDPHANYVVQTALRISEGCLHSLLVEAIDSHKAVSRNSPYSKRIFSNKIWKK
ncbi:hypothetical protein DM860_003124 [Cuscuta australis]|uniref:PUM-HD domain-containing protein n=1 Tax=Cuscuta australis TaxID=267555 RepID=A0A328D590_9ASTE|nr:hypothetical protein DM860_003124 [Cuscuta australis]